MRSWTWIACGAAVVVLGLAARAAGPFAPAEGDFAVAFPALPDVVAEPAKTRDDPGRRAYIEQDGSAEFEVVVDEYPASIPPPEASVDSYRLLLNAHARQTGLSLVGTTPVQVSGRPALEGRFEGAGRVELMRIVMVGRNIYQIRAAAGENQDLSSAMSFTNSFALKLGPGRGR